MNIPDYILTQQELLDNPPVLFDIGASGELHQKWKSIAAYSICVAFDADEREFSFAEKKSAHYKRLYVINRIVTDRNEAEVDFYLTRFPFCSSALPPDENSLSHWAFGDKFHIEKKLKLPAVTLSEIVSKQQFTHIDWYKADTQGTDLRIYLSLPEQLRKKILVAEFEPGIMDGYRNEDKLSSVLTTVRAEGYFVSEMEVKGTQRLRSSYLKTATTRTKMGIGRAHRKSPGWAEIMCMRESSSLSAEKRSFLLAYCFAWIEDQYGYALEIAEEARKRWDDPRFEKLAREADKAIRNLYLRLPLVVLKKQFNKLLQRIHV